MRWAVDLLDPPPDASVLEIGCGPGAAAELVCARLTTGRLLACDRSATAVRRTNERNAAHVRGGRLVVRQVELAELDLPPASFDLAFTVDVNLFWVRDPAPELAVLRAALRPGGVVHLVWGGSTPSAATIVDPVRQALDRAGFADPEVRRGDVAFAVSAVRPG